MGNAAALVGSRLACGGSIITRAGVTSSVPLQPGTRHVRLGELLQLVLDGLDPRGVPLRAALLLLSSRRLAHPSTQHNLSSGMYPSLACGKTYANIRVGATHHRWRNKACNITNVGV